MAAKGTAANLTITGATGTGKTTKAETFIDISPATVILDFYEDYEAKEGIVTHDFGEAIDYTLSKKEAATFRLVYRDPDVERSLQLLTFINAVQKERYRVTGKSLVIVHEEAWRFSTPQTIPPILHQLYTGARRWRVANIAISQRDVNMNPTIRAMSQVTMAFANMKLSEDTRQIFGKRADSIPSLPAVQYPNKPKEDVNYIQVPQGFDVDTFWKRTVL
jgi:hypothetical protein